MPPLTDPTEVRGGDFSMDAYTVRPRQTRDGYNLESERLSHGRLWYRNQSDAIGFAKWNSRVNGGRIEVLDEKNEIIQTEEFAAGNFAY